MLFGDPALGLKIPLPRMPTGVAAHQEQKGVRIDWDEALDSNGNQVAGYHVYRASSPSGPYVRISTELITNTGFMDAEGGGSGYYYGITSEDADGDESVQSLGVSAAAGGSDGGGGGCFIGSVGQSVPEVFCWMLMILTVSIVFAHWRQASGVRLKDQG